MTRTVRFAVALAILLICSGPMVAHGAIVNPVGCDGPLLPASDDESTGAISLPFSINFFGAEYNSLYVNNNGNVTFDFPHLTFTPFPLVGTTRVIIAPFFGDVDTRGLGSGLVTGGVAEFGGRPAFCVNWDGVGVGYFAAQVDKLNKFQLLLVDRSDVQPGDFDIVFNYDQIQWETGQASGGMNGLGGSSARVGYSNGKFFNFELTGSGVNGALLDGGPAALTGNMHNSTTLGRYIFAVRNGTATRLTELSPAKVWVGLKNSDSVGLRLDLKADVFLNGILVGYGERNNVSSGSSGFNNARLNTIPLALDEGPVQVPADAELEIQLSVRRTCFGGGHRSGTARLWFNDSQANSGFDATIDGATSDFFLRDGFALATTPGPGPKKTIDVGVNNRVSCQGHPGRPFTPFGTWSITLP